MSRPHDPDPQLRTLSPSGWTDLLAPTQVPTPTATPHGEPVERTPSALIAALVPSQPPRGPGGDPSLAEIFQLKVPAPEPAGRCSLPPDLDPAGAPRRAAPARRRSRAPTPRAELAE